MNANEFVKKHGWDAVIDAVESTNAEETAEFESKDVKYIDEDNPMLGVNVKVYHIPYLEVKSLVESHEVVESYGGLDQAKSKLEYFDWMPMGGNNHMLLSKAILDVESCQ